VTWPSAGSRCVCVWVGSPGGIEIQRTRVSWPRRIHQGAFLAWPRGGIKEGRGVGLAAATEAHPGGHITSSAPGSHLHACSLLRDLPCMYNLQQAIGMPWNNDADLLAMMDALRVSVRDSTGGGQLQSTTVAAMGLVAL